MYREYSVIIVPAQNIQRVLLSAPSPSNRSVSPGGLTANGNRWVSLSINIDEAKFRACLIGGVV